MKRYIAKIKKTDLGGQIKVNNPFPYDEDGNINKWCQGALLWYNEEDESYYHVTGMDIYPIEENKQRFGFTEEIVLNLDSKYQARKLDD